MCTTDEDRFADKRLLPSLVTALSGLPIGLLTVSYEYGLGVVACVASSAAELLVVYRTHVHAGVVKKRSESVAEVIEFRPADASRPPP